MGFTLFNPFAITFMDHLTFITFLDVVLLIISSLDFVTSYFELFVDFKKFVASFTKLMDLKASIKNLEEHPYPFPFPFPEMLLNHLNP